MGVSISKKLLSIASATTLLAGCGHGFGHSRGGHGGASGSYHSSSSGSSGSSYGGHGYAGGNGSSTKAPGAPIARPVHISAPPSPVSANPPPPGIRVGPYRPSLPYGYAASPERPVSVVLDLLDAIAQGFAEALVTPAIVVVEPLPPVPPPPVDPADAVDAVEDPRPPAPDYYGADLGSEICDDLLPGAPLPRGCKTENLAKARAAPTPPAASGSGAAGSLP
jgi:hypothetical protein